MERVGIARINETITEWAADKGKKLVDNYEMSGDYGSEEKTSTKYRRR